jgi:hypothetical protein
MSMRAIVSGLAVVLLGQLAHAGEMQEYLDTFGIDRNAAYSGTRHMESREGQMDMAFRQAPQKMRMEMSVGGQTMAIIHREDLGKNYMLMPQMNMYRETPVDQVEVAGANLDFSEVSKVGEEAINGYDCTKYRAKFEDAKGGRAGGYYWVSEDGILMKVDMIYQSRGQKGDRLVIELRDLEIGPQDPAYFEIPAGYSKMPFGMARGSSAPIPVAQEQDQPYAEYEEPELDEQVEDAVKDETEDVVVDEARKSVRKGLKKLFSK